MEKEMKPENTHNNGKREKNETQSANISKNSFIKVKYEVWKNTKKLHKTIECEKIINSFFSIYSSK